MKTLRYIAALAALLLCVPSHAGVQNPLSYTGTLTPTHCLNVASATGIAADSGGACSNANPHNFQGNVSSYSILASDIGRTIIRSNGGANMQDVMLAAGSTGLVAGSKITIQNDDPTGVDYVFATIDEYPNGRQWGYNGGLNVITGIEGGPPLGGGCAVCDSMAPIGPGYHATWQFDGVTTTYPNGTVGGVQGAAPSWSIGVQTWRLVDYGPNAVTSYGAPIALATTGNLPATGGFNFPFLNASNAAITSLLNSVNPDWPLYRLVNVEAVMAPLNIQFGLGSTGLFRQYGTPVSPSLAYADSRTGNACYPRDTLPFTCFTTGVPRLVAGAGLVKERAATNVVPNSDNTGAATGALGSGGSLPTSWSLNAAADANLVVTVLTNDTYQGANRIRLGFVRSGSSVANNNECVRTPLNLTAPSLSRGGMTYSMIVQVEAGATGIAASNMTEIGIAETGTNAGTTVIFSANGTNLTGLGGPPVGAFATSKVRVWRAVITGDAVTPFVCVNFATSTGNFNYVLTIMASQFEDSSSVADYTTWTVGSRSAESPVLDVPTIAGNFDLFVQTATPFTGQGYFYLNQSAGAITPALANEPFAVLKDVVAFPTGLDFTKQSQIANLLEPMGTPETASSNWVNVPDNTVGGNVNLWGHVWSPHNHIGSTWAANYAQNKGGSQVFREELRDGDTWAADAGSCWSCERSLIQDNLFLTAGTTYWASWTQIWECEPYGVGQDGMGIGSYWLLIDALHSNDGTPVPFQTNLEPGGFLSVTVTNSKYPNTKYAYISPTPWTNSCGVPHWRVAQWQTGSSGFLNEWMDGTQIVAFNDGGLGNNTDTPYFEFEIYRSNFSHGGGGGGQYPGPAKTWAEDVGNFTLGTASLASTINTPPTVN